jgi:rhodanese-related sulfurtransferase
MPETFPNITPIEALARMASDAAPTLLDVRLPEDQDGTNLPGAVAVPFDDLDRHLTLCPFGAMVICHKGLKISAGATARLRRRGVDAHRLTGGHVGWVAAGLPVTDTPAPDRLAIALEASAADALAAWATVRFIAPRAELLEVSQADLDAVRARFNAAAHGPLPDLPGLNAMADALDLATLALHTAAPSALFPMFDLAFRGALSQATMSEARP